jgi:hypothetical protein
MIITARLDGLRSILGYVLGLDSVTALIVSGRGLPALRGAPLACPFHHLRCHGRRGSLTQPFIGNCNCSTGISMVRDDRLGLGERRFK